MSERPGGVARSRRVARDSLSPQAPVLRQVFGFTGAEASVAIALSSGRDLEEIARTLGVNLGTLRNQLKTILGKTGVHRQAGLVAVLLSYATAAKIESIPPSVFWSRAKGFALIKIEITRRGSSLDAACAST